MKIKNMIVLGIFLSIFSVHILSLIFFERGEGSCALQLPFFPTSCRLPLPVTEVAFLKVVRLA